MPTEIQTVAGASQFDGTPIGGFFGFATRFSALPRSTRIVINGVSYTEIGMAIATNVWVRFTRPGGVPTAYALLGRGLASLNLLSPIAPNNAELFLCGRPLFREIGDRGLFWDVMVFTENKANTATVAVDYQICPFPETDPRDSQL